MKEDFWEKKILMNNGIISITKYNTKNIYSKIYHFFKALQKSKETIEF